MVNIDNQNNVAESIDVNDNQDNVAESIDVNDNQDNVTESIDVNENQDNVAESIDLNDNKDNVSETVNDNQDHVSETVNENQDNVSESINLNKFDINLRTNSYRQSINNYIGNSTNNTHTDIDTNNTNVDNDTDNNNTNVNNNNNINTTNLGDIEYKTVLNSLNNTNLLKNKNLSNFINGLNMNGSDLELYHKAKDLIRGMNINNNNIYLVLVKVLELVDDKTKNKSDVVYNIFQNLVTSFDIFNDTEKNLLLTNVSNMISLIDKFSKDNILKSKKKKKEILKANSAERVSVGQIIESLYEKLQYIESLRNISNINDFIIQVPVLVASLIKSVEDYKYLTGMEKKEIIVQSLQKIIDDHLPNIISISEEERNIIDLTIKNIPNMIDILVSVGNNKHNINLKKIRKRCSCKN